MQTCWLKHRATSEHKPPQFGREDTLARPPPVRPPTAKSRFFENAFAQPAPAPCDGPLCLLVLSDNAA
jgi:hypothetical protein